MEIQISKIIRSKRKSIALYINRKGDLEVKVPRWVTQKQINELIDKKKNWIIKHQQTARLKQGKKIAKTFTDGDKFLYLGEEYTLRLIDKYLISPVIKEGEIFVSQVYSNKMQKYIVEWYKSLAREKITERVNLYCNILIAEYSKIKITNAKYRWGSCTKDSSLNFTWRLIMAPRKVIDYVVIHEVAHLKELNHSKRFWEKVKFLMPDYKEYENWLTENDYLLGIDTN